MQPPIALEAFCAREYPRLVGALDLFTGNVAVAEELADEALVRVCEHWEKVQHMEAPGAWAHRVAMNLAKSYFRRKAVERRALARLATRAQTQHLDPDTPDAVTLRDALALLPAKQRTVLILRYYLDLPADEIAEVTGTTSGAVRVRLHRGLRSLRAVLDPASIAALEGATDG